MMSSKRKTDLKDIIKKKPKLSSIRKHDVGKDKTKKRIHAKYVQYRKREKKSNKSPRKKSKSEKPVKCSVVGTKASERIQSRVKTDMKDIKRREPDIIMSTYIEKERQKMLLNKESLESIENEVYHNRQKVFLFEESLADRFVWQKDCFTGRVTIKFFGLDVTEYFSKYDIFSEHIPSRACNEALRGKLISLLRNWNLDLFKECMDDYNIRKNENTVLWPTILLKIIPRAMLEHCAESNIIADFFHCMCKDSESIRVLVKIIPSYMQFYLMNMAAVNRIECSMILESNRWISAKKELIKRAFLAGQVANLQLFLQYFRPDDLFTPDDLPIDVEVLNSSSARSDIQTSSRIPETGSTTNNGILTNLVRIATYVTVAEAPKDILAECIRLIWRASKTQHITLKDIDDAFILNHIEPLHVFLLPTSKELFQGAYPNDCIVRYPQPRSLVHLSRCEIRRAVTSAVHVHFLPLPEKMKEYLNLEW